MWSFFLFRFAAVGVGHNALWKMWGETHSRSTNYRDTSAGFVSLFAAVGRGVLVLVVIAIVTATAMDTPALSHTHIAIWPYMRIPRENQRTRRQTFAYVALAFSDTDALTSHFFFVFAACTSYVMLEFHFCCNALGENCSILLRFLHRSPPPFIYESVFHVVFPRFFPRFPGLVLLYILMCLLTVVE